MENASIQQATSHASATGDTNTPEILIQDFLWQYSLTECKTFLWDWLVAALQDKDTNAGSSILFYESLIHFLEAAYQKKE
ncbi:hypothetical protein SAMN05428949_0975 [Chitinophaga sp. YR627]|uniref:hypothetical protein n=1 Tax=Chitinophaga sp. YR627 TaxID=1881041 RepID=UPI0008E0406C|nr:hypothetical protein [Chitinophaga sp. YR627]SFM83590.1 hypothetical protein SAMN05428949_0975 [Chitinophaga sp. YR627]